MGDVKQGTLGDYLRSLRAVQGLSLRDLESKSGVSNAFLSQIESGKVREPSPIVLFKLARALDVAYDSLMLRAGYPTSETGSPRPNSHVLARLGSVTPDEEESLREYLAFLRSRKRRLRGP